MGAHWTKMEMDLLCNLYPDAEIDELLKVFNRPVSAIRGKAFLLRLKKSDAWIEKHSPRKQDKQDLTKQKRTPPKKKQVSAL